MLLFLIFVSFVICRKDFIVYANAGCTLTSNPQYKCLERVDSTLLYHQLLPVHNSNIGLWNIDFYLFSIKAWYLTQKNGLLVLWTNNNMVLELFSKNSWVQSHSDSISVKYFDFKRELESSILKDSIFQQEYSKSLKKKRLDYEKISKYLILWKYGGFYFDNNLFLLQDLDKIYELGLQFSHLQGDKESIMFLWKNSPLGARILYSAAETMGNELNAKNFTEFVIRNNIPPSQGEIIYSMNLYQVSKDWFDPIGNGILKNVFSF